MKVALLSVYDKNGLETFARSLKDSGWNLLASSGTARYLAERGIETKDIAGVVGKPILGHRVVTLSREIHAALLASDLPEDAAELSRLGVPRIDLVYVNLYPLREEIAKKDSTRESVVEKTDIGGPTLLRSAAKGGRIAVTRAQDIPEVLAYLKGEHPLSKEPQKFLSGLTSIAEREISEYCAASAEYHRAFAAR